jgi:hypothetical protein
MAGSDARAPMKAKFAQRFAESADYHGALFC